MQLTSEPGLEEAVRGAERAGGTGGRKPPTCLGSESTLPAVRTAPPAGEGASSHGGAGHGVWSQWSTGQVVSHSDLSLWAMRTQENNLNGKFPKRS